MANSESKLSAKDITGPDSGRVSLKGILKNGSPQTQALKPAAMDGFQVADFHRDSISRVRKDDAALIELRAVESQLAKAKSDIAQLNNRLTKEVENARAQGLQEGHFKGLEAGQKAADEVWQVQIDVIRKDVAATLDQIAEQHASQFTELQNSCVELAIGLSQRLYYAEAEHNENLISHIIAEAFQYLGQDDKLRIRLNPLDLTLAEKGGSFWRPLASNVQSIDLVPDSQIARGGCFIDSEKGGSIDMRTQTLLKNLEESIRSAYAQALASL